MNRGQAAWEEARALIRAVDWSRYETAYGNAGESQGTQPPVARALLELFSPDQEAALEASHALWCGLCHQHAYLSTAALPALDVLLLALESLDDERRVEVLDILYGFAACTAREAGEPWQRELRSRMEGERPRFQALTGHENEDIRSFAELIVETLEGGASG